MAHDPLKFITGLSSKLATRSRHVCWFLGAGTSRACGLPDVRELTTIVLQDLNEGKRQLFERQLQNRNLEQALSRVRAIKTLLSDGQEFEGVSKAAANELDVAVCNSIVKALTKNDVDLIPARQFAVWVGRSRYMAPVEVFTVNYDLLLERAFDKHRTLYFDGFCGTVEARFQIELAEGLGPAEAQIPPFFSRLWKLHGSVNWSWNGQEIVRSGAAVAGGDIAAIYPSELKYEESRRFPFVVLQDRFRRALNQPETLLIVCGYAFGDQHLNELIFDAAQRHQRSEVIAFMFGEVAENLAERALATPNFQLVGTNEAVIGGVRAEWRLPEGESTEFVDGNELKLPDFSHLTKFLSHSSLLERERDPSIKELLELISAQANAVLE